jgi:hypothetical protein
MRIVFLFAILLAFNTQAMRIPDALTKGAIISENGYEIDPSKTKCSNATFSVRVDKDTNFKSLNEYANKWLKSYGQFGIEVLGHQYFKNGKDQKGIVIDLANSSSHKKLRQVIFFKDDKAAVLTCMDQADKFTGILKDCNDLIRSFTWIESAPVGNSQTLEQKL